jgi:hypothetical protein
LSGPRGHDPNILICANLELIEELQKQGGSDGRRAHPRIGEVGIVDATRLFAPVAQIGPRSPGYLAALRRPGMDLVDVSTYRKGTQYDTVYGWRAPVIVDQATMLPLVWTIAPASADENALLFGHLLPALFRYWPNCPMHTLVGDSHYDTEKTCRELERLYSLHPVFIRSKSRETEHTGRRDTHARVIDGQPRCRCGGMKFRGREGFYTAEQRLRDGRARGVPGPDDNARVRWICPNNLCGAVSPREVSLWVAENPRDHTWWPRGGDSDHAYDRRALETYRAVVESLFSVAKHNGIGTRDGRALWARDRGITWLFGLHLLGVTARRVAHETGAYELLKDEFLELGFHRKGTTPSEATMREAARRRLPRLQWSWPEPARATDMEDRRAA